MPKREECYDRSWMAKARAMKKMTQLQVAEQAGLSEGEYCRIENGVRNPGVKIAIRICDVLGADIRQFLDENKLA